jgi:hypothetical protein
MTLGTVLQINADSTKVRWNSTNQAVAANQTLSVAGNSYQFGAMEVGLQEVALTGASVVAGDFLRLSGNFAFHRSASPVTVKLAADTPSTVDDETNAGVEVNLMTLGADTLNATFGSDLAVSPTSVALKLTNVSFGLALMSSTTTPSRRWTSLQASAGSVSLTGVSEVALSGSNLAFNLNTAEASDDAVVDYSAGKTSLSVATGVNTSLTLDMAGSLGRLLQASATVTVDVFGFVQASGQFAFRQADQNVTLSDGHVVAARVMTLGANSVNAFAGLDGSHGHECLRY